ncbi:molecular chaperone DnaK [Candidatus Mancarchaeum acidiphilum]|uniref:Chaperone protein DnaK n=1 Tax=Candidatus Mancarchaeum acidiphilum TaxID=1920749 RepID=A0A218NM16_9ARCH|nr:molecular chaperone DnaK [Candidatus Mancarchaeum acidiphilum]ASI13517.1 molecular chaperone DnaK [Candidatus Mancarchaeum acidiphilum]
MSEKIIGIDLGTSNSAAAVLEGGRPTIIPSSEGASLYGKAFPSYVAFTKDNQILVGEPAKRQAVANPEGTISGFKRKMGTDFIYHINNKDYKPQELSAMILQKIKRDAEAFLGEPVKKAVITVPAYFNDNQRQATKDAGAIAGLDVVRLVNEPTAACLAYGLDKNDKEMKILVYDLGGGTLDVTIMEFGKGVFEVKSTSGDTQLGGTDMDKAIVDFLVSEINKQYGIDVSKDIQAIQRLKEAAEKAKIELSTVLTTDISLPFLSQKAGQPINFSYKLDRAKLESLVLPIIERSAKPVRQALEDSKIEPEQLDKIILIGGPTRMPITQRYVEQLIGKKIERGVDPMEAVALGAAIQGGVLTGEVKDILLLDVTPLTLSIETLGGVATPIIKRNTTIPIKDSQVFTTADDFQTSVDIHVCQGERPLFKDNIDLGRFTLTGLPPAKRGVPQIEVTFDIDSNGILHVTAKDKASGKSQSIDIVAPNKMNKDDIEKKIKEAQENEEKDKKIREQIEIKNNAESMIYTTEHTVEDLKDKLSEDDKKKLEDLKSKLQDLVSKDDYDAIKAATNELQTALADISSHLYQAASGNSQGPSGGNPGEGGNPSDNSSEGTTDANFKAGS